MTLAHRVSKLENNPARGRGKLLDLTGLFAAIGVEIGPNERIKMTADEYAALLESTDDIFSEDKAAGVEGTAATQGNC